MAKRIYSAADIFLMPSRFEPCGLEQLIALRFGTIPLVRQTGGLADTISEFNAAKETGNGFIFSEHQSEALFGAMERAARIFQNQDAWTKLMKNAMACDFSWTKSARQYEELYKRVEKKHVQV
jgi:starch synthase